jgi:hypothetical protein
LSLQEKRLELSGACLPEPPGSAAEQFRIFTAGSADYTPASGAFS